MTQIQLRRGTASEWSAANPVLAAGEVGVIGTTGDFKIGDGATTWNLLPAQSSRYVAVPTAWTAVTFTNSWVNYGAPFQVCQYRKIGDVVEIRGVVKTGAIGTNICTLPAGYRPPANLNLPCASNGAFGMITVTVDGNFTAAVGNNAYVSFDVIFSVTP